MNRVSRMRTRMLSASLTLVGALAAPVSGQMAVELVDSIPRRNGNENANSADFSWTLQTLRGDRVPLEQFKGKVMFINIWATWCAPCVQEMGSINALRESLADTDIEFLLVSPEQPRHVSRFLRRFQKHKHLPVLVEYSRMPDVFGLEAVPTTYIVDRYGRIVFKLRGTTHWDTDAARELLRALAEEDR